MSLCLIEQVENTVFIDNIPVNTWFLILRNEEWLRFTNQICKVVIGIRIVDDIGSTGILHRPVHHIFSGFRVENRLRCPNTFQLFLSFIAFLHVDDGMRPVYKVIGLQQHHRTVWIPTIVRYHICHHHIKGMTILTSQNMRVAHTTGRTDHFRIKNGLAVIQCPICISIHTYGITYSFFTDVVTCKVGEQISHIIFFNDRMLLGKRRQCHCQH